MALKDVVYRWESWREVAGSPQSRERKELERRLQTRPALLYWGDSWFMTPLYLNLAAQSMRRIDGVAMVVGKAGATAAGLFTPRSIKSVRDRLLNNPFDVLCLSAGGNDALSGRLERVFGKRWSGPRLSAHDAFDRLVQADVLTGVFDRYANLLKALEPVRKKRPQFRVIAHGYAPLRPNRIGVGAKLSTAPLGLIAVLKRSVGPWLWGPMRHVLKDRDQGKVFADLLLQDGFRDQVLKPLAKKHEDLFTYVDFAKSNPIDDDALWYDEIHPTEDGFAALAPQFNDVVRSVLPQAKRGAVIG